MKKAGDIALKITLLLLLAAIIYGILHLAIVVHTGINNINANMMTRAESTFYYTFPDGLKPIVKDHDFWLCENPQREYLRCYPQIDIRKNDEGAS